MDNSFNNEQNNFGPPNPYGDNGPNVAPNGVPSQPQANNSMQGGHFQAGPNSSSPAGAPGTMAGAQPQQSLQQAPYQTQTPSQQPQQQVPAPNQQVSPNDIGKPKRGGNAWMVVAIIFIVISLMLGVALGWLYPEYTDNRDNVNYKISQAVADETKSVSAKMEEKFQEDAKSPYALFVGPDDYGRVSFDYPKTWSVYVENEEVSGKPYTAYFHPSAVPPISNKQQIALRLTIEDADYDKTVNRYANLVKKGELKSSPVQVGLLNGTRLDGSFSKDIRGAAAIFKVRDKTITVQTDSNSFMADFDRLIQTIKVQE